MKKRYYVIIVVVLLILIIFASIGLKYTIQYSNYLKQNEVGAGNRDEIFTMLYDLLYIPQTLPPDMKFASLDLSMESGHEHMISYFANPDHSKTIRIGAASINLNKYTYKMRMEFWDTKESVYTNNITGDTLFVYQTDFTSFFIEGSEKQIPLETLEKMMVEYVEYLTENHISK